MELVYLTNSLHTPSTPVVVHCSAGVGRTGTFVLVHAILAHIINELKNFPGGDPEVNVSSTLVKMREQRTNLVQTSDQYELVYRSVLAGARHLLKSRRSTLSPALRRFAEI